MVGNGLAVEAGPTSLRHVPSAEVHTGTRKEKVTETRELARKIRIHCLRMANRAGTSHIGSCLSCADILAVLYGEVMQYRPQEPDWKDRDRFILSKGHAGSALYATLAECGFFPVGELDKYHQSGSILLGHVSHDVPGVEASAGSLGHGLSIGCGMTMATQSKVFVLLSDGDMNEGSTWEAAMFAGHHKLHNLIAIVDYNQIQALGESRKILNLVPLSEKWEAFGWRTVTVNGHDTHRLGATLKSIPQWDKRPTCVIAHTVKGKGVSFLENRMEWHYKSPSNEELEKALEELR